MQPDHEKIQLSGGFPRDVTDDELATAIRDMLNGFTAEWGSRDLTHLGGDRLLAFVHAGLQEQTRREVQTATASARFTSWIALRSEPHRVSSPSLRSSSP